MALGKCHECNAEVSDQAKTCPKCGISKPVRKPSTIGRTLALIFVFGVAANFLILFAVGSRIESMKASGELANYAPPTDPRVEALSSLKLENLKWNKSGFGNVMLLTATIKNDSRYNIKDLEIECKHYSKSDTYIDSNKRVVYDVVKSKKTLKIREFNMGLIHTQANSTNCEISDLVVLPSDNPK